jgi:UDP-N-acetylglucosamine/UDP-N-acetylgalactosamine diphosphorylase
LDDSQRNRLIQQLDGIDLGLLGRLWQEFGPPVDSPAMHAIQPAPVQRQPESLEDWERDQQAAAAGEAALRAGQVAVILVAGGQGTRLGHPGPKGTFPIGPVSKRSLFQVHAQKVLAISRRYESPLMLCIMTSPENDAATREFFAAHKCFGLEANQVSFFAQGTMPAIDVQTGRLLLAAKDQIAVSPNGHGGVVEALASSGLLAEFQRRSIHQLFYFQVDNPLVKIADPAFLGQHLQAGAEMSLKVVPKLNAEERLGVVVQVGGQLRLIEYSDLSAEQAQRRNPAGELELWAGSIAIHLFDVAFLERLVRTSALPHHRALKMVRYVDDRGQVTKPETANAIKFEKFVFDALPLARRAFVVETSRREEFEPLKNADGENSPASVRQALSDLYADWLRHAGVSVPCRPDGSAAVPIEIGPLYACDAEELRAKLQGIEAVTEPLLLD